MGQMATNKGWPKAAMPVARWMVGALALAAMSACGGGGGAAAEEPAGNTPGENPQGGTTVLIDALPQGTQALKLAVDSRWADPAQAQALFGGETVAGWNIRDPQRAMVPGMKIAFFGVSDDCEADAANGPVVAGAAAGFASAQALTGMAADAVAEATRWTPSGRTPQCQASAQDKTGPNWIFLNPSDTQGGIGMLTQVGPDLSGQRPFLAATSPSGIDGTGYNANGLANFVAFRRAWNTESSIRPWLSGTDGSTVEARIVSRQSMGSTNVGPVDGQVVQVKQQIMVSLINTECQKGLQRPCQIQYLFNTAAVRAGVTDWEAHSPARDGKVWFDKAQAGLPIVAGLVPAQGGLVVDVESRLPLYRSAGAATQHQAFRDQPFDLRVSFAELQNAARIIAARQLGVSPAAVTDEQMATRWSAKWNSPQAWTLVSSTFGHEIYNAASTTRHSHIGGGFRDLYVGPSR